MKLVISVIELARSSKIKIEKFKDDDTAVAFHTAAFVEHKDFSIAAKRLGLDETKLQTYIKEFVESGVNQVTISLDANRPATPKFRVRDEIGVAGSASLYDTFSEAIHASKDKQVIEWDCNFWACNLDIDFDKEYTPPPNQLINFITTVSPQPSMYWISRSGGCHLIYQAMGIFSAEELASIAAYQFTKRFPCHPPEFLHRSRNAPGEIHTVVADCNTDAIRSLLTDVSETDPVEYLANRGWSVGMRLPHTECPVNPHQRAEGNSPPVVIKENGIHCYVCERDEIRLGSRRPGIFSYAALMGNRVTTQISNCVKQFVHYGHAKHVLGSKVKSESMSRLIFSCLLKMQHGEDARVPLVFTAGEPNGLVRHSGYWCDSRGDVVALDKNSAILKQLPHCLKLSNDGTIYQDDVAREWLSQTVDQSVRGYYSVMSLRGIQFSQFQLLPSDKVYTVLNSDILAPVDMEKRRPRYLPQSARMRTADAWKILDKYFPKIDQKLIELLLVGRGCVEHRSGLPPMVFISGITGSGKTSHPQIAAAIAGDTMADVKFKRDTSKFDNALFTAKKTSSFFVFDEVFKFARAEGYTDVAAMEQLLGFTPNRQVYLIYVGTVCIGDLPLYIFCDTQIPVDVSCHEQIGRRMFTHHLATVLRWEPTMNEYGINEPRFLRSRGPDELIDAANAILSDVIDRHFTCPATDFAEVATSLGFKRLRDSEQVDERRKLIADFYVAVCNAPDIRDANDLKRWSREGFKIGRSDQRCPLYDAFISLQTEQESETILCRILEESDLQTILRLSEPCTVEIRKHGSKYAFRFAAVKSKKTNKDLAIC